MAIIRCKMCKCELEIEPNVTVCRCKYCRSEQTVPNANDEKKMKLFDRANRLRLNCEFDKAAAVFESITNIFPEEAEGYWGNLLCAYGIEYVDDPATGEKIPTCHRSSFTCFLDEDDFEQVMENSDAASRKVYREQAKQIEEIRKGIIEVSDKEQPYDLFICYKETDENGDRTIDSVLAQDVYDALTAKGYRVFFSRISLEDKLGTEYEPYIFAALNSAKVLLAFGTSYDYYNAVWVKNEWNRYLKLTASDKSKHLIPCYKDIDAYDIPKEFRSLQAQDMGKVGAIQDLIRGIDKLMGKTKETPNSKPQTVIQQVMSGGPNVDALLKRGYDSLEDGAFEEAKTFFNDTLNSNAQCAEAYLGLFMAEIQAVDQSSAQLKYVAGNYIDNRYWKRAQQYASAELADTLTNWDSLRNDRLQQEADALQKAKEEAEKQAKKAKEEEEQGRKKIQEEIKMLKEQQRSGNYKITAEELAEQQRLSALAKSAEEAATAAENDYTKSPEYLEVARIEELFSSKKAQLLKLGFFNGKKKQELLTQISTLEKTLEEAKAKASEKHAKTNRLKKQAEAAKKKANEYETQIIKSRIIKYLRLASDNSEIITFGRYEQGNGVEPVTWQILDIQDGQFLLISQYALECRAYHGSKTDINWKNSDLRKWLNDDFLKTAFVSAERNLIANTLCAAEMNPQYNTGAGISTRDKVFLLSTTEVEKYFTSDEARKVAPTLYAKKQGAYTNDDLATAFGESCWWWLRSPGYNSGSFAARVNAGGAINYNGYIVSSSDGCVRPALYLNLNENIV